MRSTSRGCRLSIKWISAVYLFACFWAFVPLSKLWAEQAVNKDIILIELYHKELDHGSSKRYFDGLKRFLREELSLEAVKTSSLRTEVNDTAELPAVPVDTVFNWRKRLGRGKKYFKELEITKGAAELRELIDAPYRFSLGGKALDLVSDATLSYSFILFKIGDRAGSEKLVSRYVYLSGKKEVSDQIYPPDFVSFFNEISSKNYSFSLAVNSTPSGAQVLVGDLDVGETPLVRKVERFGSITLTVRKRGYIEYVMRRFAMPGDRITFDLDLEIDAISEIEQDVTSGNYERVAKNMHKLNSKLNVIAGFTAVMKGDSNAGAIDYILSMGPDERGNENHSIFRDIPKKKEQFSIEDLEPLLEDELFLSILPHDAKARVLGEGFKKRKLTEKWWFWALVGAGVAGVVYAIAEGSDNGSGGTVNIEF